MKCELFYARCEMEELVAQMERPPGLEQEERRKRQREHDRVHDEVSRIVKKIAGEDVLSDTEKKRIQSWR